MLFPKSTFDDPQPVAGKKRRWVNGDRLTGLTVTAAFHIVIVAALILGVRVARPPAVEKPVTVDIVKTVDKPQPPAATPKLQAPSVITAPMPMIDIAPATPTLAILPPRALAAPVAAPGPVSEGKPNGEGRASYLARLLAQLNRFKQYPPQARAAHIEGVAMVHFIMDRGGNVMSAQLAKSSGRPALDREALQLMMRASPLPAMPGDMPGDTLDAVVPIEFSLHD